MSIAVRRWTTYAVASVTLWSACTFPQYKSLNDTGDDDDDAGRGGGSVGGGGNVTAGGSVTSGGNGAGAQGGAGTVGGTSDTGDAGDATLGGAGPLPQPLEPAEYRIVGAQSSKCVDAGGPKTPGGDISIQQFACNDDPAQQFELIEVDSNYYELEALGTSTCVDVEGASTAAQAVITRMPCSDDPSQQWHLEAMPGGTYQLVNRRSNLCLEVPGQVLSDTPLQQYTCNGGQNQRWVLASLTPTPVPVVVDDFFGATTWDGQSDGVLTQALVGNCNGNRPPKARGYCHTIVIDSFEDGATQAGQSWLLPEGNWGKWPGLLISPEAIRVHFQARGAQGGETLRFSAGGLFDTTFVDHFSIELQSVSLTTDWKVYELVIDGLPFEGGVVSAFTWSLQLDANTAPLKFYIDDIVWE